MPEHLDSFHLKFQKIKEHLIHELATLRTGRATPSMIEHVSIHAYGSSMKLMELCSISAPDPKTLVMEPWDKAMLKDIERGLTAANTGCSISIDKNMVRLSVPALTQETREQMQRQVQKEVEKARVALRGIRDEVRSIVQEQEKNKEISKDDRFRMLEQIDKDAKMLQGELDAIGKKKESELEF